MAPGEVRNDRTVWNCEGFYIPCLEDSFKYDNIQRVEVNFVGNS